MNTILVTGANKGIGLAVVEAILREQPSYNVILGSRDLDRGNLARDGLLATEPAWAGRIDVLELDVTSGRGVSAASTGISTRDNGGSPALYGLVNNAGAGSGTIEEVFNVNVYGVYRVCEAFAPMMKKGGRIVNVTSAAGPNFVSTCDKQRQAFFQDSDISWEALERFMQACRQRTPAEFVSLGMGSNSLYGLSKACANSYTLNLAKRHPQLRVNACTPGFIETDLGKAFLGSRTPAEAGMKSPAEGAQVVMALLFDPPRGSGHYYGSDGLRSPLNRYRAPGAPEYNGDE